MTDYQSKRNYPVEPNLGTIGETFFKIDSYNSDKEVYSQR
jgi:hypothetical protein